MPKIERHGATYSVDYGIEEVQEFARTWPCFGPVYAHGIFFEFDARNGDLVNIDGDTGEQDERGVWALSQDAMLLGARMLGLRDVLALRV